MVSKLDPPVLWVFSFSLSLYFALSVGKLPVAISLLSVLLHRLALIGRTYQYTYFYEERKKERRRSQIFFLLVGTSGLPIDS